MPPPGNIDNDFNNSSRKLATLMLNGGTWRYDTRTGENN